MATKDPKKVVYVDESGIDQENTSKYGYATRGKKIYSRVTGRRCRRVNIVAGQQNGKVIGATEYAGSMTAKRFESWFTLIFLPCLEKGTTIVLDNASFHNKSRLPHLAQSHGCKIIFLPPYSPDLNPIEKLWANLKNWLRVSQRRYDSIYCAIQEFIDFNSV